MTCLILLKYEFMVFWLFLLTALWGKPVCHSSGFWVCGFMISFSFYDFCRHEVIYVEKIKIKVVSLIKKNQKKKKP